MAVSTWLCALSFGRCRMSKFWLLVYFDFFVSLHPTLVSTGRGVREGGYEVIWGSKSSLESGSHLTLLTSSATAFCFRTVPGSSNYAHRGDLAPSRTRSDATDLKETASGANSLRRVLDHKHAVARLARKPCDGSAPPAHSSLQARPT